MAKLNRGYLYCFILYIVIISQIYGYVLFWFNFDLFWLKAYLIIFLKHLHFKHKPDQKDGV